MTAQSEQDLDISSDLNAEAKALMSRMLKIQKPTDLAKKDPRQVNQFKIADAVKNFQLFNVDDLSIQDHYATNSKDNHQILIKSFIPKAGVRSNAPITMFIHGGGFVFDSVLTYMQAMSEISRLTQSVWLSVEYRLAPDHKYPVGLSDCSSAFSWLLQNKSLFSSVPNEVKLGVAGDSAGGNLAAMLVYEYRAHIDYQILMYPWLDIFGEYESNSKFQKDCFILVPDLLNLFRASAFESPTNSDQVSPMLKTDLKGLPRDCLILAAYNDPFVDQSIEYARKLRKYADASVHLEVILGTVHGFFNNTLLPESRGIAFREIRDFLSRVAPPASQQSICCTVL